MYRVYRSNIEEAKPQSRELSERDYSSAFILSCDFPWEVGVTGFVCVCFLSRLEYTQVTSSSLALSAMKNDFTQSHGHLCSHLEMLHCSCALPWTSIGLLDREKEKASGLCCQNFSSSEVRLLSMSLRRHEVRVSI